MFSQEEEKPAEKKDEEKKEEEPKKEEAKPAGKFVCFHLAFSLASI